MRSFVRTSMLVLTLAAMPLVGAQAGKLEGIEINNGPTAATTARSDFASHSARSSLTDEILASLPSNLPPEAIDAFARRHRLIHLESQSVGLLGKMIHRWRIADGRSIHDVVLALERDGAIDAQSNNSYALQ